MAQPLIILTASKGPGKTHLSQRTSANERLSASQVFFSDCPFPMAKPQARTYCSKDHGEFHFLINGKIAQWQSACSRTKKSAVQVSATASCCGGELFTYIQLMLLILASRYCSPLNRERNAQQKQTNVDKVQSPKQYLK